MFISSARKLAEALEGKKIVVVGGGRNAVDLVRYFQDRRIVIVCIFDNNVDLHGKKIAGINVKAPYNLEDSEVGYVISTNQPIADILFKQLQDLKIDSDCIFKYYSYRSNEFLRSLPVDSYKSEISDMFLERIGYDMNWDCPKTYNEIINWEKLYSHDERRTVLADKFLVREWISKRIGETFLVKEYGVFDSVEDINFDLLPHQFVLKVNNGSCRNIIVKDKNSINREEIISALKGWCEENYAYQMLEMHYKNILPKILCEEYIKEFENGAVDFKIYCFNDEPYYIQRIVDEHKPGERALFYDTEWKRQKFNHYYDNDEEVSKPVFLQEMIEKTRLLCRGFSHVRVDWFVLPTGKFYFGEMTFSSWAGLMRFTPPQYDLVFGKLIRGEE